MGLASTPPPPPPASSPAPAGLVIPSILAVPSVPAVPTVAIQLTVVLGRGVRTVDSLKFPEFQDLVLCQIKEKDVDIEIIEDSLAVLKS